MLQRPAFLFISNFNPVKNYKPGSFIKVTIQKLSF